MLKIKKFVFSPFQENTYVVYDLASHEGAVIDPGCYNDAERRQLADFIEKENISVKYLLNTHCHIDHIFGNRFVTDEFKPRYLAPEKDVFLLKLMEEHAGEYGVKLEPSPEPDGFVDDETISLGERNLTQIFTPGHTPGEFCFYCQDYKVLFSGDVLFRLSIGRTDLWGGNYDQLISSIENKLYVLPDDVVVYPGHDVQTTIGYEKKHNPYVSISD